MRMTILFLCVGNLTKGKIAGFKKDLLLLLKDLRGQLALGNQCYPQLPKVFWAARTWGMTKSMSREMEATRKQNVLLSVKCVAQQDI